MRWTLASLERGQSCVFKLENEDVWAVGWSDCITRLTLRRMAARVTATLLRNYKVDIARPKVIATYQSHMGWVDRHNRFRQDILGLHNIWKTKRWQMRVQIELMVMALVDAFLIARKFLPRWKLDDESESSFFRFLRELLPTVADAAEAIEARQVRSKCSQILTGKGIVKEGAKKGQDYAKQGRCHCCIKRKT